MPSYVTWERSESQRETPFGFIILYREKGGRGGTLSSHLTVDQGMGHMPCEQQSSEGPPDTLEGP